MMILLHQAKGNRLPAWTGAVVLSLATVTGAIAAERQHSAHVHGVGHLNIAVEIQTLEIELISPAADIAGFEHSAETEEDKAVIKRAIEILKDGKKLFHLPLKAECQLEDVKVETSQAEEMHEAHDEGEQHDKEHEGEEHAEFHAHYHFHCNHPGQLTHLDVRVFEFFPNSRALQAQIISSHGQNAMKVTPATTRLEF